MKLMVKSLVKTGSTSKVQKWVLTSIKETEVEVESVTSYMDFLDELKYDENDMTEDQIKSKWARFYGSGGHARQKISRNESEAKKQILKGGRNFQNFLEKGFNLYISLIPQSFYNKISRTIRTSNDVFLVPNNDGIKHMNNKLSFLLPGLKLTLEEMPNNGVIVVLTDSVTKQKKLEKEIQKLMKEKNIKIFFVFAVYCMEGCKTSHRLSDGRAMGLFLMPHQKSLEVSYLERMKLVQDFNKNVVYMVCNHSPLSQT